MDGRGQYFVCNGQCTGDGEIPAVDFDPDPEPDPNPCVPTTPPAPAATPASSGLATLDGAFSDESGVTSGACVLSDETAGVEGVGSDAGTDEEVLRVAPEANWMPP